MRNDICTYTHALRWIVITNSKITIHHESRLTPRKIPRDAYRPSLLKITMDRGGIYALAIFLWETERGIKETVINNSQVDYWIQDSDMRVRFIEYGAMFRVHIGTRLEFKFERIRGKKFGSFQQLPFFRRVWDDFEILPNYPCRSWKIVSFCLDRQE